MMEHAEGKLDGARAAHADAEQVAGMFVDQLANRAGHVVEHRLRSGAQTRRQMDRVERFAVLRHGCDAEIRAAEIDADGPGIHESTIIREGSGQRQRSDEKRAEAASE